MNEYDPNGPMNAWLEQAWMSRYLDRQLDAKEAEWFEAYALDKPQLLDVIEADTRLRDALAAGASARVIGDPIAVAPIAAASPGERPDSPVPVSTAPYSGPAPTRPLSSAARPRRAWLAVAAALVGGVGTGALALRGLAPDHSPNLIANPTRIVFDAMRGEAVAPRVEHADSRSRYVLIEMAAPPDATDIAMKSGDSAAIPLALSPDGFISLLVERKELEHGAPIRITYKSNATAISFEIPFTIVRQP